jgi:hypothetical protein
MFDAFEVVHLNDIVEIRFSSFLLLYAYLQSRYIKKGKNILTLCYKFSVNSFS